MGLRFVSYTISSKDVPGRWSLVLFMKGCNFRCRHCHNWRLVTGDEREVKSRNPLLKVRVDTNGYAPQVLEKLRDVVDGFAVDIKSPIGRPSRYSYTAGRKVDTIRIRDSAYVADGLPLSIFRTPKYPWLTEDEFSEIEEFVSSLRSHWYLNEFYEVPSCPFNV